MHNGNGGKEGREKIYDGLRNFPSFSAAICTRRNIFPAYNEKLSLEISQPMSRERAVLHLVRVIGISAMRSRRDSAGLHVELLQLREHDTLMSRSSRESDSIVTLN